MVEHSPSPINQVEQRENRSSDQTVEEPNIHNDNSQIDDLREEESEENTRTDEPENDYMLSRDRNRRVIKPPLRYAYSAYTYLLAYAFMTAVEFSKEEPNSYQETITCKKAQSWMGTMKEEMNSLYRNHT